MLSLTEKRLRTANIAHLLPKARSCFDPIDLACLHYRSAGGQCAPVIIRTKGHRLEGIWHTGSMLGMVIHAVRGVHVCVPRNMTQAAGMYNTLAQGNDPAIVIEVLNGYRRKERLPSNYREFTVPLGVPEILRTGKDLTLLTYGACVEIAHSACETRLPRRSAWGFILDISIFGLIIMMAGGELLAMTMIG